MNVLFFFVVGAPFSFADGTDSYLWKKPDRLKNYQNATEIIKRDSKAVYYQTTTTNIIRGEVADNFGRPHNANFTCWSVNYHNSEEKNWRNFKYQVSYRQSEANTRITSSSYRIDDEPVQAVSTDNYTSSNAIQYDYSDARPEEKDPVIFTDGTTCDLFNVPRNADGKGCELWVADKYKDNVPACCSFLFDLLCAEYGRYDVYGGESCKEVVAIWNEKTKTTGNTMRVTIELPVLNGTKKRGDLEIRDPDRKKLHKLS